MNLFQNWKHHNEYTYEFKLFESPLNKDSKMRKNPSVHLIMHVNILASSGCRPEDGVRDMIVISDIDETGINENLKTRYKKDLIYVSFIHLVLYCMLNRSFRLWIFSIELQTTNKTSLA